MKILKLSFTNLNSLSGTWNIDFTDPAFTSSGIFVITGPTGSGKTTVLDAICLALYGRTPRLGKITKTSNHIMSRHTGDCSAEVLFESQKGRYICHWSQRRAHNKSHGELQQPQHEVSSADTGEILATKIAQVQEVIEDATGMTYDQFTRSILLAQGGFAAFLQAGADDRAPILEQITGTEIYTELSIRTHNRYTEEQKLLDHLNRELDLIQVLSPEEKAGIELEIEEIQKKGREIDSEISKVTDAIRWLEGLEKLQSEMPVLVVDSEKLSLKIADFEQDRIALLAARKASPFEGIYAALQVKREALKQAIGQEQETTLKLDTLKKSLPLYEKAALDATREHEQAERKQQQEKILIKIVCGIDSQIQEAKNHITQAEQDLKTIQTHYQEQTTKLNELEKKQHEILLRKSKATLYTSQHAHDAPLRENYSGIESKAHLIRDKIQVLEEGLATCSRQTKTLETIHHELTYLQKTTAEQRTKREGELNKLCEQEKKYEDLLSGLSLPDHRVLYENLRRETEQLSDLFQVVLETAETETQIGTLEKRRDDISHYLQISGYEKEQILTDITHHEDLLDIKRKHAILAAKVRDLTEERNQLVEGIPCPLCGSSNHPFVTGMVFSPDEAFNELQQEEKKGKELNRHLTELTASIAQKEGELKRCLIDLAEKQKKREQGTTLWREGAISFGLNPDHTEKTSLLCTRLEDTKTRFTLVGERISDAEKCADAIKKANAQVTTEQEILTTLEGKCREKDFEVQTLKTGIEQVQKEIVSHQENITTLTHEVNLLLKDLGVELTNETNINAFLLNLKNRHKKYQAESDQIETCVREIQGVESEISAIKGRISEKEGEIRRKSEATEEEKKRIAGLVSERKTLFGEKNTDTEEKILADDVTRTQQNLTSKIAEKADIIAQIQSMQDRHTDVTIRINTAKTDMNTLEREFLCQIQDAGFPDEPAFSQALLTRENLSKLEKTWDELKTEQTRIEERIRSTHQRYEEERAKDITRSSLEDIKIELSKMQEIKTSLISNIGKSQEKLSRHEEMVRLTGTKIQERNNRQREVHKWYRLHELIGSADGKKFRVFAQGLTFCILLDHANRHLKRMTDRYILVQDTESPLDMQVIDTWQAGVIRSVKNLSGGEIFMVSLALALGLSGMASQKVRVDSLFLDEGFGTLDDEALETALSTLSGLQQGGKLIGIISHVAALKERIPTRIIIEKGTGGKSRIIIP